MNLLVKQNVWHQKVGGLFSDESNFEESFLGLLKHDLVNKANLVQNVS
jgi:hypothetical protein